MNICIDFFFITRGNVDDRLCPPWWLHFIYFFDMRIYKFGTRFPWPRATMGSDHVDVVFKDFAYETVENENGSFTKNP